jgi:hypothetical protein
MSMFSILHISDLHRSVDDPISNDELVASLVVDRERYTRADPAVRAPDAIVVSGDIIQGVELAHADSKGALASQYAVAEDFLVRLAHEFVQGDRSRVIVAPGNHDVDWNVARQAMEKVPAAENPNPQHALKVGSDLRWSWKERCFYRIVNSEVYERRFDAYWDFVHRFYKDVKGIPSVGRNNPFSLFQLFGGRIGLAVFNSCRGNDCYAFHGAIEPSAIAMAHELMRRDYRFQLWVGVWHHSIQGTPYQTDYMDMDQVQNMVGYGFRLGLHGHQHRHQVVPMHVHLPDRETMTVVSAGSLCAGAKELPTGFFRQYNVIEIDDNLFSARVHVRQMETAHLFSGCHMTLAGGKTYVDISWFVENRPAVISEPKVGPKVILDAERLVAENHADAAAEMLATWMPGMSGYGRTVFLQACIKANKWALIVKRIADPQSIDELVALVEAYDRLHSPTLALDALRDYGVRLGMQPSQQTELEKRIQVREVKAE